MPKIVKHLLAAFPTGASHFNGGEVVFQMGGFIFKWWEGGGAPHWGASVLMGGFKIPDFV